MILLLLLGCGVDERDEDVVPEACGVGAWGGLDDGSAVTVGPGGDYSTVQAGVDAAAGGRVVVAAGTYLENLVLLDGTELIGRCAELVTLDGSGAEAAAVAAGVGSFTLSGLTVTGGLRGIEVTGGSLIADALVVTANMRGGILVQDGASLRLSRSVIRDTLAHEDSAGYGLLVWAANATITESAFEGNAIGVLGSEAGATVDLLDTNVVGGPVTGDAVGVGVMAQEGAAVRMSRGEVRDVEGYGIVSFGAGSAVVLTGVRVADTRAVARGDGSGRGLLAVDGASMLATDCLLEGNVESGGMAGGAGASLTVTDSRVAGTRAPEGANVANGLSAFGGASLIVSGSTIEGTEGHGVYVDASSAHLTDTTIQDPIVVDAGGGSGVYAIAGGTVELVGCRIERSIGAGVNCTGAGTRVILDATMIADTAESSMSEGIDGLWGSAVLAVNGGALQVTGSTLTDNAYSGIVVNGGTAEVSATLIRGTHATSDGGTGAGLMVAGAGSLRCSDCVLDANQGVGAYTTGGGSRLTLVDVEVANTTRGRVAGMAAGIVAERGGVIDAARMTVHHSSGAGVYALSGTFSGADCVVTDNTFAGAVALAGGTLELTRATITGTLPDAEYGGGVGLYASDLFGAATVTMADSTIGPHAYAAVWLDGDGIYDLTGNTLYGGAGIAFGDTFLHGNALFAQGGVSAWNGVTGLRLVQNTFQDAAEIAVFLHDASATLDQNVWANNGLSLRQQRCADVPEVIGGDLLGLDVELCPPENRLIAYDFGLSTLYLPEIETDE